MPDHVKFATYTLRHNKSYWAVIEQLEYYGERGMIDAEFIKPDRLIVRTENIKTFSLGPVQDRTSIRLNIEGQVLTEVDLNETMKVSGNLAISISPEKNVTIVQGLLLTSSSTIPF